MGARVRKRLGVVSGCGGGIKKLREMENFFSLSSLIIERERRMEGYIKKDVMLTCL